MQFRQDNIDYKELVKRREEKKKQLQRFKNPFVVQLPTTNEDVYKQLYKFDAKVASVRECYSFVSQD
jgi:dynein heavy chain